MTCGYGSYTIGFSWKEFVFLGAGCEPREVHRRCPGFHSHVQIQGSLTAHTATHHLAVADALAAFAERTVAWLRTKGAKEEFPRASGS